VWEENLTTHLISNTAGARLDVVLSTRAVEANEVSRYNNIQNQQTVTQTNVAQVQVQNTDTQNLIGVTNLGSLTADLAEVMARAAAILAKTNELPGNPADQDLLGPAISSVQASVNALVATINAVKSKTDNLPTDPASGTQVATIPVNPLLTTDPRLSALDAPISSRATPANFSGLAHTTDIIASQAAIIAEVQVVETELANKPSNADLSTALIPIAKEATSQSISARVDNIITGLITPAQVWNYATRTLTAPVDITTDLSNIVRLPDLATAQAQIIASLDFVESFMNVNVDRTTDILTLAVWLNENGQTVTDVTSATVDVYDASGNLAFSVGPASPDTPQGVFKLTRPNASTVITKNKGYTAVITMLRNAAYLRSIKSFTVV
jgi:hypothetical protein